MVFGVNLLGLIVKPVSKSLLYLIGLVTIKPMPRMVYPSRVFNHLAGIYAQAHGALSVKSRVPDRKRFTIR